MKGLLSIVVLAIIFTTNLSAQKSIVNLLFDDYDGFNTNIGVTEDRVILKPYKKLKKRDLKKQGIYKGKWKENLDGLVESEIGCKFRESKALLCDCYVEGEKTKTLEMRYNVEGNLAEFIVYNLKDTTRYLFEYDKLDRPIKTTEVKEGKMFITEVADYSEIGKVKLTYYFNNGEIAEQKSYPFEINQKKNIKSISLNQRRTKVVIRGIVINRESSEYIAEYELDDKKNWIEKKLYIKVAGRKYKVSKSTREIKYKL